MTCGTTSWVFHTDQSMPYGSVSLENSIPSHMELGKTYNNVLIYDKQFCMISTFSNTGGG
jgi:hypothetical protein